MTNLMMCLVVTHRQATTGQYGSVQHPKRKRREPQHNRDKLVHLQQKFDEYECQGVFCRPEDLNINVEYLNSSFLLKKTREDID